MPWRECSRRCGVASAGGARVYAETKLQGRVRCVLGLPDAVVASLSPQSDNASA
jgi:hypothetical protein